MMHPEFTAILSTYTAIIPILLAGWGLWKLHRSQNHLNLHGPRSSSFIWGNLTDLYLTHKYGENEYNWHAQFGDLYPINGLLGEQRLLVSDYAALKFIFNDPTTFPRTASFRRVAWVLTGEGGLFHVNEDEHHRIRKVMNAAFSPHNIRDLVPLFQDIAMKVIDHLENSSALENGTECLVDLYKTLQNATLDAVSQGALGYTLNAVGSEIQSDLVQAQYNALALASNRTSLSLIADSIIEYLPDISIKLAQYLPTSSCVALRHFRKQCEAFMEDLVHKKLEASQIGEKGKDILSVMIDINNSQSTSKLKDVDLCNQSRSLLIAGQEATGGFLSWALYELAKNVAWQKQVRAELLQLRTKSGGQLTQADVELAQYLNAHLKETMRLHPSVPIVDRTASQDIFLPLSQPISTKSGTTITEILIKKGQIIHCMISSFNRFNTVWGPDAEDFNPLHWINKSGMLQGKPIGPYANILSFISGPFTCIGWRFAVTQAQVILAELICRFEFRLSEASIHPQVATTVLPMSDHGTPHLPLFMHTIE